MRRTRPVNPTRPQRRGRPRRMAMAALVLVLGLTVTLALSACGSSSSGSSTQKVTLSSSVYGPSTAAICQKTPTAGGTLVYERQAATESLNPLENQERQRRHLRDRHDLRHAGDRQPERVHGAAARAGHELAVL